ncbi:helix-turn-helix domain-containing protein [Membranihabitans marinus]
MWIPSITWVENIAPFGLAYGPLLFVAVQKAMNEAVTDKMVWYHFIPFNLFALLAFPVFFFEENSRAFYIRQYLAVLYLFIPISILVYGAMSLYLVPKLNWLKMFRIKRVLSFSSIILITWAIESVMADRYYIEDIDIEGNIYNGYIVYSMYFLVMISIVHFIFVDRWTHKEDLYITWKGNKVYFFASSLTTMKDEVKESKYVTSNLTNSDFNALQEKLEFLMNNEELYLNPDLDLNLLSQKMRCSKHVLSQFFSEKIGMNFNSYINHLRIDKFCNMIVEVSPETPIMDVAYRSGFNSKPTFNRWFKKIKGVSPSTYRKS